VYEQQKSQRMKFWKKMNVKFFLIYNAILNHNKLQANSYRMIYRTLKMNGWKYTDNSKQKTGWTFRTTYWISAYTPWTRVEKFTLVQKTNTLYPTSWDPTVSLHILIINRFQFLSSMYHGSFNDPQMYVNDRIFCFSIYTTIDSTITIVTIVLIFADCFVTFCEMLFFFYNKQRIRSYKRLVFWLECVGFWGEKLSLDV
jgi:hypothetical protein